MVRPAHMDRNRQYDYHPLDLTLAKCMMSAVRRTECLVRALCPKKRKRERALLRRVFGSSFSSNSHTPLPPPSPFFFLVKGISCAVLSIKKRKLRNPPFSLLCDTLPPSSSLALSPTRLPQHRALALSTQERKRTPPSPPSRLYLQDRLG